MKTFNDASCPKFVWQGTAFVTFSNKYGKVTFNGVAAKMMELKTHDQVEFYFIEDDKSWYVAKVNDGGFKLYPHNSSRSLIFTRLEFVLSFFNSMFYEGQSVRCNILRQRKVNGRMLFKLDLSNMINK